MSGNMWYDTNMLKIHSNGMKMFKKITFDESFNMQYLKSFSESEFIALGAPLMVKVSSFFEGWNK